jgi:hypothetical protein
VDQPFRAGRNVLANGTGLTFSLFDRQVLVAFDDILELAAPLDEWDDRPRPIPLHLSIGARGLTVDITELTLWRDVYYDVRHRDFAVWRRLGGARERNVGPFDIGWRLGADEFFVMGDNAAISDDSRSWQHGPGLDANSLVGRVWGVR